MQIRATNRSDLKAVDALLRASYPVLLKPDYSAPTLQAALPLISRAKPELVACGTYYGLWNKGLVAAGGWTREAPGGAAKELDTAHIRHVVTDYRMIRRGYGRALMTHILGAARAAGVMRLKCQSTLTAVGFYQSMGFRIEGEIMLSLGEGCDFPAVQMSQIF